LFHPPAGAPDEVCGKTPPRGAACDLPTKAATAETYIKRVVGGPGDKISMKDGRVYRNGKLEPQSYASFSGCSSQNPECNYPTPITIPKGDYFMLGDNRDQSDDSRFWGPVPSSWLEGRVIAVCSATDNCRSV